MIIIILALCILLILMLYEVKFSSRDAAWSTIPKPKQVFLLNNSLDLLGLNSQEILTRLVDWHRQLGGVFMFIKHPFDCGTVVVSDPLIAEALSYHQPDRSRSFAYDFLSRWIGKDTLFIGSGARLKQKLKIGLNMHTHQYLLQYHKVTNEKLDELLRILQDRKAPIDIFEEANRFILDQVFKSLLGADLETMSGAHREYVEAIEKITDLAFEAYLSPVSQLPLFVQSCTSFYKTAEKTIKILNDFTLELVKNRRKCLRSPEEEGFCVIDSILQTPIDGRILTDEEAGFEINSVILGHHDTMKTAMTFLFYVLAKYPEVQEKVYHEVVKTVIDDANHDLTIEDVAQLHYLESVIKETLRLYPVIPLVGRKLRSEKQIGELIFPKDVEVLISPYLMMRNPKYFDDPLTFNPERFLGVQKMPLAYSAFSIGARKCFGGRYAITSLKMITAKFLIRNKLRLENDQEIVVGVEMTLKPKQKILLRLEQRF